MKKLLYLVLSLMIGFAFYSCGKDGAAEPDPNEVAGPDFPDPNLPDPNLPDPNLPDPNPPFNTHKPQDTKKPK